tara:strand:- start:22910 stop:23452 length:543 start_codon:yes stop_codon:yes gene_type:complete
MPRPKIPDPYAGVSTAALSAATHTDNRRVAGLSPAATPTANAARPVMQEGEYGEFERVLHPRPQHDAFLKSLDTARKQEHKGKGSDTNKIRRKLKKKKKTRRVKRKGTNKKKKLGKKLRSVSNRTKTPFLKRVTKTIPKEVMTPTNNRAITYKASVSSPKIFSKKIDNNNTTSAPRKEYM